MPDNWLKLKRKFRFAYTKSWRYHSFDGHNHRWNKTFEPIIFIKGFWSELTGGPERYEFVWVPELKIYKNIAPQTWNQMRPISWREYCDKWRAANPEWMKVISRHKWVDIRRGTEEEKAKLDAELASLRKKGLPRKIHYRLLSQLKIKSSSKVCPQPKKVKGIKPKTDNSKPATIETIDDLAKVSGTFAAEIDLKKKQGR